MCAFIHSESLTFINVISVCALNRLIFRLFLTLGIFIYAVDNKVSDDDSSIAIGKLFQSRYKVKIS